MFVWGTNLHRHLLLASSVIQTPSPSPLFPAAEYVLAASCSRFGPSCLLHVALIIPCSAGSFSSSGFAPCITCPGNTYAEFAQSTFCTSCPARTSSPAGSSSSDNCKCNIVAAQQACNVSATASTRFWGADPNSAASKSSVPRSVNGIDGVELSGVAVGQGHSVFVTGMI